jgi:hypothetical protein
MSGCGKTVLAPEARKPRVSALLAVALSGRKPVQGARRGAIGIVIAEYFCSALAAQHFGVAHS